MSENNENAMTPEQVVAKFEAKIAEQTKGFAKESDIDALKNELAEISEKANADQTADLKAKFVELESTIDGLKESNKNQLKVKKTWVDYIREKAQDIKNVVSKKNRCC